MALNRWRWALIPALAALAVLAVALPPQVPAGEGFITSFFGQAYERSVPQDPFGVAVHDAVQTLEWRVRRERLADSIVRVSRTPAALRSADGAVTVLYQPGITRDSARTWLAAAEGELALYPRADAHGLPVVVALATTSARQDRRVDRIVSSSIILRLQAVAAASGACVVYVNLAQANAVWFVREFVAHDLAGRPVGRFLGTCALYGRFGLPGAAVTLWGQRGPLWDSYWGGYDRLSNLTQEAHRAVRRDTVEESWTYASAFSGSVPWTPIACLRGGTETCARLASLSPGTDSYFWWYSRRARGEILSWLLATGTPAQFAAFWRSDRPTAQALEAAYGQPAGRLVMQAFQHWSVAPEVGGPHAGARVVVIGFAWAALALALAVAAGRRWTVEV